MPRILIATLTWALLASTGMVRAADDKPNIVLILSDDQAWGDYGFMGHPHIDTPHLDQLATEGLTFTRGYVVAPLCRPSLASLVTGLHPHQHGIVGNDPRFESDARRWSPAWIGTRTRLNELLARRLDNVPTLPRLLAGRGYVSLQTGKWWEGTPARGGFTEGMTHADPNRGGRHGDAGLTIGRQGLDPITDFIDRAVSDEKPFFVWYAPFMPHTPHTPPKRLEDKYLPKAPTPAVARYWAMCEWFDESCGDLLSYLDRKKLRENTIVVYVCDNGWIQDPDRPNRFAERSKQSPYEGGIRTPIMIRWPARLQPKQDTETLVSSIDLVPTLLRACGLEPTPAMQGLDLLDRAARTRRTRVYASAYEHDVLDINRPDASLKYRVVISGSQKLILPNPARRPGETAQLYDLTTDPHEHNDLAAAQPQTVRRLTRELNDWWTPPTPGVRAVEDPRVRTYVIPQRVIWQSSEASATNTEALLSAGSGQVTLDNHRPCVLHEGGSVLVDFGRELHGGLHIMVGRMQDKTPARFRVRFGESVSEAMSDIGGDKNATNDHAVRDQVVRVPWLGTQEIGSTGFRFVRLDLEDKGRSIPLVGLRAVSIMRDLGYRGSFRCSDERLNRIWQTGAYTVHLNMQDYLWDGIKRDRLVWIGDMHPETMTIFSVFGDQGIIPKSLDLIRDETPLPKWMNGISSYSMWWVLIHHEWYRYTADRAYLRQQRDYLLPLLKQLCACIDADNREKMPPGRFLDWPSQPDKQATHAGLHALLVLTLDAGAELCDVLKASEPADACRAVAGRLRRYCPDPGPSKQAAALMALAGLQDAGELNDRVMAVGGAARMSTFYGYYVLQARARAGDIQGCLDCIRDYWGAMLDLGATSFWEDFDLAWTENAARIDELVPAGKKDIHGDFGNYCYLGFRHSLCHGWASGPTAWLSEHVLGITILEPGCRKVRIAPQLGDLAWAEGTYPTPLGLIRVAHVKLADGTVKSTVTAPEGMVIVQEERRRSSL
jgi:arylsulfatase A-like enzyme